MDDADWQVQIDNNLTGTRLFPCGTTHASPIKIVLEVTQRGYRCGDKVFRPAKVIGNDLSYSPGVRHAR